MRKPPTAPAVRFRVDPAYVPADKAARRMGLTPDQFVECQRRLYARGFPVPDETTGLYDIEAIDRWRKRQRPDLYPEVQPGRPAVEPAPRTDRGERFVEARTAESMGERFAKAERTRRAKTSARNGGPRDSHPSDPGTA